MPEDISLSPSVEDVVGHGHRHPRRSGKSALSAGAPDIEARLHSPRRGGLRSLSGASRTGRPFRQGVGNSTLLLDLFARGFEVGAGVALLGPHGDLSRAALADLLRRPTDDLSVSAPETPRSLSASIPSPACRQTSHLPSPAALRPYSGASGRRTGARLDDILIDAIRALSEAPGATLRALPRALIKSLDRARQSTVKSAIQSCSPSLRCGGRGGPIRPRSRVFAAN